MSIERVHTWMMLKLWTTPAWKHGILWESFHWHLSILWRRVSVWIMHHLHFMHITFMIFWSFKTFPERMFSKWLCWTFNLYFWWIIIIISCFFIFLNFNKYVFLDAEQIMAIITNQTLDVAFWVNNYVLPMDQLNHNLVFSFMTITMVQPHWLHLIIDCVVLQNFDYSLNKKKRKKNIFNLVLKLFLIMAMNKEEVDMDNPAYA